MRKSRWFYEKVKVVLESPSCTPTAHPSIHPAASFARHARNARALTALPQAHMCMRVPIEALSCHVSVLRHGRNGGREGAIELAPWTNVLSLDAGRRA
jgi:hypothetical protein